MSTAYAIIMLAVTVGIVVQTSQDSWTSPNAMFIIVITAIYVLAGLLHPEEFMCLMPGVLYFLCIPSGKLRSSPRSLAVRVIQSVRNPNLVRNLTIVEPMWPERNPQTAPGERHRSGNKCFRCLRSLDWLPQ